MDDLSTGLLDRAKGRVGSVLREKWRLDRLLGIGGMAAVYAATHRNGSRGAIKMLHTELSIDAEVKRRFLREGYVANAVDHPGTVKVLDDDVSEDGAVFIVMELLEGETLEAYSERRGGRLSPGELLPIVDQLLTVLAVAHARGVVHRDIKPENVFITVTGVVKLLDFGIARLRRNQGSMATVSGATFGTPAFMPPEQALGRTDEVDARSDVWSVGATMFTLLSGRAVHLTQTLNEQLVAHAAIRAPSLATTAPALHSGLVGLVDRAMAYDKADRWQSATAMHEALRQTMSGVAPAAPVPVGGDPRAPVTGMIPSAAAPVAPSVTSVTAVAAMTSGGFTPPSRRNNVLVGAGVGAVFMLLGLLIVGQSLRSKHPPPEGAPAAAAATTVEAKPEATAPPAATAEPAPPAATAPAPVTPAPPAAVVPSAVPAVDPKPAAAQPSASPSVALPAPPRPTAVSVAPPAPPAKAGDKPKPAPSPTAKPSKGGDWLERQH